MAAITLTSDAPRVKPITKTINGASAKPVTQRRLELIAQAVEALYNLPAEQIEHLVEHIQMTPKISQAQRDLAASLGVEPISEEEKYKLESTSLENFFEWRKKILDDSLTAPEVAKLINAKSRQTPHDRFKRNDLVAVKDAGVLKFPRWQFDPQAADGVIDGLPDVLKALKVPDFSKISWLTRPNPALDGFTPIDALKRGNKDEVISLAKIVGVL
ncbi:MAG: DUF2384 domain-containing protein [Scytonematopsis contorta HA4267-MV1]|jgi:uncharacterized protein (DUF2384 family)|nr:DUF2384 domain-containing protein [Scytonematopsis contorta HA4267-MV1]